ncbi:MAG: IclR family transcriptional regulator [Faecalibacterium sp.]
MNNTIFRSVQILNYIADRQNGTTLQEISNHFDIPKSSAFVIVQSLLELDYIATSPFNEKSYCLGVEAFVLGMKYFNHLDVVNICIAQVQPLADQYGKTAFISVVNDTKIAFVGKYVAPTAVLATCALGSRKQVYATASGKAFLAFLPAAESEKIIEKIEFERLTDYTIVSKEKLEEEIVATRLRGYALERQEDRTVSACCAVPVYDYTGKMIVSISLSDVYNPEIDDEQMGQELKNIATEISKTLGYAGRS